MSNYQAEGALAMSCGGNSSAGVVMGLAVALEEGSVEAAEEAKESVEEALLLREGEATPVILRWRARE